MLTTSRVASWVTAGLPSKPMRSDHLVFILEAGISLTIPYCFTFFLCMEDAVVVLAEEETSHTG